MKVYQTHPTNTREEEKRGPHPIFQMTMAQFVPDSTTENRTSLLPPLPIISKFNFLGSFN